MSARVIALSFAAVLVALPAHSAVETTTTAANPPTAAAVVTATDRPAIADETAIDTGQSSKATSEDQVAATVAGTEQNEQTPAIVAVPQQLAARDPAVPAVISAPTAEPFGLAATGVVIGEVLDKWRGVEADIRAESGMLARCRDGLEGCAPEAQRFLDIIAQGRAQTGRARIGVINRAINLAIEPMSDLAQWGVPDRWSAPLETFATGRGDCEDYAIAKYVALTEAGLASQDVRLVIVRNTALGEDHAVVAVRLDGNWLMLDNRTLALVTDSAMPQAVPLFVLDRDGIRQFTAPALTGAQRLINPASLGF